MLNQSDILSITSSLVFRKLPPEVTAQLLRVVEVLQAINEYTLLRHNELFWDGGFTAEAFNKNYRVVCPPTSMDIDMSVGFPWAYKTIFVERVPFTPGKDYAKFGIHKKLKKPLLEG